MIAKFEERDMGFEARLHHLEMQVEALRRALHGGLLGLPYVSTTQALAPAIGFPLPNGIQEASLLPNPVSQG